MFVDERKRQAIANPRANAVPAGSAALAAQGRNVQQGPANFAGSANGPKAVRNGAMPPPPVRTAPAPMPVAQPAQVANRGFRGQTVQRPMIQQMARAAPPNYTLGADPRATGRNQNMAGSNYGKQDTSRFASANVRAGAVPPLPTQASGMTVLDGGRAGMSQGGAGSVQTRVDSRTPGEFLVDKRNEGRQLVEDANGRFFGALRDGPGGNTVQDAAGDTYNAIRTWDLNGVPVGGSESDVDGGRPDLTDPASVIEWMTRMGLDAASGAIGPAAEFANKLNDVTKPSLKGYFDNFADLDNVKASGDRFMDPEFYQKYDDLQREQLQSDVDRNRDAMMRTALSRQAGGGRGMSGNFAGQVMDSSNRAISEGNRGIAQDSLQRQLSGTQAGAQMKQGAQAMIYDLMNQGRTDPREILAFISEVAPEMASAAFEFLGEAFPG